jgi:hypothetical protein
LVKWQVGELASCQKGKYKLMNWQVGKIASWQNNELTKWHVVLPSWQSGKLKEWQTSVQNGKLAKWQIDEITIWWNGKLIEWQVGKMASSSLGCNWLNLTNAPAYYSAEWITAVKSFIILLRQKTLVKAGLHYGDFRSKLVPFEAKKNIFFF